MKQISLLRLTILLLSLLPVFTASADHTPGHAHLEWGIGVVALTTPDYLGSSYSQSRILPFPYIKYRGDILYVDDGIEGRFFKSPDLLLSVSGNGSLPSPDDNPQREGMDELDATFELGPSMEYRILETTETELWFELPLRFAFRINSDLDSTGHTLNPRLAWRRPAQDKYGWKLKLRGGLLYADSKYHGYFYDVPAEDVTGERPEFDAEGGYSGVRIDTTFSRRFNGYWFGGFIRYDNLDGSEIESSPLVTETDNWSAGLSLAWIISEK